MKKDADDLMKWVDNCKKLYEGWHGLAKQIVQRYALEGSSDINSALDPANTFNILWSNVQTLKPALYSRMPEAEVARRFGDTDPVARTACTILERACNYELDCYPDFNSALSAAVLDRLLPGRGVAWVRYDPAFTEMDDTSGLTDDAQKPKKVEVIDYERSPIDYVHWQDFYVDPARTWEEVKRVGRRVLMNKKDGKKRFGKQFEEASFDAEVATLDNELRHALDSDDDMMAEVYEIWDLREAKVYWIAKGYDKILEEADDPLGLEGFFPCPKPLFATLTNESLIPTPDYAQYITQAVELDLTTTRIQALTNCLQVVGVYAGEEANILGNMFSDDGGPKMIPVDNWLMFADKGGVKGLIDWFPVEQVVVVLKSLIEARESIKQTIYELTGISDIVRGASAASETATAQQLKGKYANMRLSASQQEVAQFAQDLIRIKINVIAKKYSPQTLITQSGIMETDDAEHAQEAIALIKSGKMLSFRVAVNADDLSEMRQMQVKQDRNEFLVAVGGYMTEVQGLIQTAPELTQLAGRLLMYGIQSFPAARELEGSFEDAFEAFTKGQEQRTKQAQSEQQTEQAKMQAAQQEREATMQSKQMELAATAQENKAKRDHELALAQIEQPLKMADAALKVAQTEKTQQETLRLEMENATYAEQAGKGEIAVDGKPLQEDQEDETRVD